MARLDPEGDFVFTLSDEEAPNVDSDTEIVVNNKGKVAGTKRRRDEPENIQIEQSANSKKRKKQKKSGKNGTNSNITDKATTDDAEEEDEFGEDENGVLNPDFEFDVGGVANGGLVEDFDGWGDEGRNKTKAAEKKGVDIDDILDRRRQKKLEKEERERKKAEKRAAEEHEDMDNDEAEAEEDNDMQVDLDDDELLAPDAFGMGAQGASESEAEGEEAESDEDGEESNPEDEEEGGDDEDDDTNSVASAVPHPDDLASDEDGSGSESEDDDEIRKQNEFFAPEDQVTESKSTSGAPASFQNLSLSRPILRGLASVGFSTPTPIQRKTIPVALLGKDVVGGAVTGSGKTGAFIVPILERLLYRPRKVPTSRVAILMPTRELAVQCYNVATKLATFTDITFCQLVGGFSLREQENILKKRPDVIIATPGRFIDHMRNSASFTVDTLEILVLDEADQSDVLPVLVGVVVHAPLLRNPDRKVVKEAVKAGRAQGAKIVSRVIEPAVADKWAEQVNDLATEVEEVLQEEKEEKQLAQAEMQVTRGKNLIDHQEEIMSRPKRTWFESEKDKRESKKRGLMELNGPDSVKKGKKKLSGKDKKKLDDTRMREEGRVWKKGKAEREAKPGSQNKGKKKKNSGKAGKKR
ncbi:2-isopropylmalate synthase [Trichophyton equinum CBS 127.97]|uniref:RNA helicase n=1 Tax=Trichophyton equinum (strain ATCC MYA-4606 / CBS 127.97) TaxID=559882 RepID=F2PVQ8_TRIEC|nr:2-isopropylmalate synthase [Trichophyton equinum CBS 127.97]